MKRFNFSGGEVHLQNTHGSVSPRPLRWLLRSSDDIMAMLLYYNAQPQEKENGIVIPYFPYARQDRIVNFGEPLSVQVMAQLVNSIGAKFVEIWDPHSDVTPALINNVRVIPQESFLNFTGDLIGSINYNRVQEYTHVIAPDLGAEKKASRVAKQLNLPLIQAIKKRDLQTGQIVSTQILGEIPEDAYLLVPDDICDGGRTFIELAKKFPESAKADLYVTNGIFSNGLEQLKSYYHTILCASVFNRLNKPLIQKVTSDKCLYSLPAYA